MRKVGASVPPVGHWLVLVACNTLCIIGSTSMDISGSYTALRVSTQLKVDFIPMHCPTHSTSNRYLDNFDVDKHSMPTVGFVSALPKLDKRAGMVGAKLNNNEAMYV